MDKAIIGADEWMKLAESQGFEVEWNATLTPKEGKRPEIYPQTLTPSGHTHRQRLNYQMFLKAKLWWQELNDEDESYEAGPVNWSDQDQLDWVEKEAHKARKLLELIPASGEIYDRSMVGKVGVDNALVNVGRGNVALEFWAVVAQVGLDQQERSKKQRELNEIFDNKVREEMANDPELAAIRTEQKRLSGLARTTEQRLRVEKERQRKGFIYVAGDEPWERDGL